MNLLKLHQGLRLPLWAFVCLFSFAYILLVDVAEFFSQPLDGLMDTMYMLAYFIFIALLQVSVIGLIAINKYIFAVVSPVLLILGTILTYFFISLNVTLSPTIVGLVFSNDIATSADLITLQLILFFFLSILISASFIYIRFKCVVEIKRRGACLTVVALTIFVTCMFLFPKIRMNVLQRQPFIIYDSIEEYFALRENIMEDRHNFDNEQCIATNDSITVVLIIGESMRSDHLGVNGYDRNTTPLLGITKNVVSYPNLRVSTFHTSVSIPRIMTRADENNPEIGYNEQSFITLFKNAGYETSWIANQEPLPSFVYFVEEADTTISSFIGHSHYNYDKWLDEVMLDNFEAILQKDAAKKLVILHTIGCHWWYNTHYDKRFAKYKPELISRNVKANSISQLINSYDNCVLYTDWFLSKIIEPLKNQNAIMIFISDHGEGLGENGKLLHGQPSTGTEKAALLFWVSDKYKDNNPQVFHNIVANKDKHISNDILFHTILDCGRIKTAICDTTKSVAR